MSLKNSSHWNSHNLQKHAEEIEEIGYFAALNLNYNCTDAEVKRNYEEIFKQLQFNQSKHTDADGERNENFLVDKLDLKTKRKLGRRIVDAYKVLGTENLRKQYLEEIRVRCYLSQVVSLDQLINKYSGRLFPYFIFELHKKAHGLFHDSTNRFFHINFIDMTIEERKDERLIRAFNFSSVKQAVTGFKKNELYLTTTNGREVETFHYQVKYSKQRNLLVELITFAKRLSDKKSNLHSENMKNPTVSARMVDKTPERIVQSMLGVQTQDSNANLLKLLTNDRVTPAKQLFQCEVYTKSNNFLSSQKKLWIHIGTSQIIVSTDKTASHILQIYPVDREYLSLLKVTESGAFTITCQDSKTSFRTVNKEDVDTIIELVNAIFKEKVQSDHIIYSLPYNKKMLTLRMKDINTKIDEAKTHLNKLRKERNFIKALFAKEKEKTKVDPDMSVATTYSKVSSSLRPSGYKTKTSLEGLGSCLTLTTPPRSPRSRTIMEDHTGLTPSGERTLESRFSFHKPYSKSMTFTDKVMEIRTDVEKANCGEYLSPDFKRPADFEVDEVKLKGLQTLMEENNLNDSLSEEINKDLANESRLQTITNRNLNLGFESPMKVIQKLGSRSSDGMFSQSGDRTPKANIDASPSFCKTDSSVYDFQDRVHPIETGKKRPKYS